MEGNYFTTAYDTANTHEDACHHNCMQKIKQDFYQENDKKN